MDSLSGIISHQHNLSDLIEEINSFFQRSCIFLTDTLTFGKRYTITGKLRSNATEVLYALVDGEQCCLKRWLPCHDELYKTEDNTRNIQYILKGFDFNSAMAKSVYLGVARIKREEEDSFILGRIISKPSYKNLDSRYEYVLVMKRLKEKWRLDHYLLSENLVESEEFIKFLATSIAHIHAELPLISAKEDHDRLPYTSAGTYLSALQEKLAKNLKLFRRAMTERIHSVIVEQEPSLPGYYQNLEENMYKMLKLYRELFERRYANGHVKRCHGDLKALNLWIRPAQTEVEEKELLLLDCVDFEPTFYYIDTLSDIAMLVADLHAYLLHMIPDRADKYLSLFLTTYLTQAGETHLEDLEPLLEYFITEKAMVCAYMWVLYDQQRASKEQLEIGKYYFQVAERHAKKLQLYTTSRRTNYIHTSRLRGKKQQKRASKRKQCAEASGRVASLHKSSQLVKV